MNTIDTMLTWIENINYIFYYHPEKDKDYEKAQIASFNSIDGSPKLTLKLLIEKDGVTTPLIVNNVNPDEVYSRVEDVLLNKIEVIEGKISQLMDERRQLKFSLTENIKAVKCGCGSKLSDIIRMYEENPDSQYKLSYADPNTAQRIVYLVGIKFVTDRVEVNPLHPTSIDFKPIDTVSVCPCRLTRNT